MSNGIRIEVNGEPRGFTGETVSDLLHELSLTTDRVAVELNLEILDRQEFARRRLQQGDRVEILSFIGGGAPRCRNHEEGGSYA
ncbi:MAG TPA: sulfur carrier protein ThiS [Nitrospira sp.]|nr:sulfur carrier protein ThiS [Nitrospira sp.]